MVGYLCPWSFHKSIALLSVTPSDALSSFILFIQHSLGLHRILYPYIIQHVVHCVEFCQLSFILHVQTFEVFVELLCLAKSFGRAEYLLSIQITLKITFRYTSCAVV